MRSRSEILEWVVEVFQREFEFERDELRLDTHLMDDLDLDSIDAVDLAVRVEEKTGLSLSADDLKGLQTLRDVVELIHERL